MYIGLYLLIPLLNSGYKSLKSKSPRFIDINSDYSQLCLPPTLSLIDNNQKFIIIQHLDPRLLEGDLA